MVVDTTKQKVSMASTKSMSQKLYGWTSIRTWHDYKDYKFLDIEGFIPGSHIILLLSYENGNLWSFQHSSDHASL